MANVVKVLDTLERKLGKAFREIFKSITVDNGSEFQDYDGMQKSLRRRTSPAKAGQENKPNVPELVKSAGLFVAPKTKRPAGKYAKQSAYIPTELQGIKNFFRIF